MTPAIKSAVAEAAALRAQWLGAHENSRENIFRHHPWKGGLTGRAPDGSIWRPVSSRTFPHRRRAPTRTAGHVVIWIVVAVTGLASTARMLLQLLNARALDQLQAENHKRRRRVCGGRTRAHHLARRRCGRTQNLP
jgi:hypothetical protein